MMGTPRAARISKRCRRLVQFFVDQKVLPAAVPIDRVITNKFIDDINSYDRAGNVMREREAAMWAAGRNGAVTSPPGEGAAS